MTELVQLPSLNRLRAKLALHLQARQDSALIAAPGSGSTTLAGQVVETLRGHGIRTYYFDLRSPAGFPDCIRRLETEFTAGDAAEHKVAVIDHVADLLAENFDFCLRKTAEVVNGKSRNFLWIGPLDGRAIWQRLNVRIYSVPRAHLSFPTLQRDELLSIYRSMARTSECRWGEAILFLLLDWCGNDLALVKGAAEFLHGDWTDKLYDESIWDRVDDWLRTDGCVGRYRQRLQELKGRHGPLLEFLRLGAKPACHREEVYEETDDALRCLFLQGVLGQNLLPGYYQPRNLLVRYLLEEPASPPTLRPSQLLRRFTNERVGQLLQDIESTLRSVLLSVFRRLGQEQVRGILEGKQGEREFLATDLNQALLGWAQGKGGRELREDLNSFLVERRKDFKVRNTLWAKVASMMAGDRGPEEVEWLPDHLRCVDYLTFGELSDLFVEVLEHTFTKVRFSDAFGKQLAGRWRENLAKIQRMRNRAAHLRNIYFQDMEDIIQTIMSMRTDLLRYAGPG